MRRGDGRLLCVARSLPAPNPSMTFLTGWPAGPFRRVCEPKLWGIASRHRQLRGCKTWLLREAPRWIGRASRLASSCPSV